MARKVPRTSVRRHPGSRLNLAQERQLRVKLAGYLKAMFEIVEIEDRSRLARTEPGLKAIRTSTKLRDKRGRLRRIPRDVEDAIVAAAASGAKREPLAAEHHVSRSTVFRKLRKRGLTSSG